jgi:hypothetical protein
MRYVVLCAALLFGAPAFADCSTDQTLCEAKCKVSHLTDDAARTGCISKCVAQRAACSTGKGAEKAVELGKGAWESTKSFVKGATE